MDLRKVAKARKRSGANIPEFGTAFTAFFFVVVIPCINLVGFSMSYGLASKTSHETAEHISKAASLEHAKSIINQANTNLKEASLYKTFRLKPGESKFKLELAIESLNGQEKIFDFNSKEVPQLDRSTNLVRYRLTTDYRAQPVIDLSAVPILNKVWIIGSPTPIKQVIYREIEHPEYLHSLNCSSSKS